MEKALEKIDVATVFGAAATAFSGMFAGGSLYINVVQIPALNTVKDTFWLRQCWKETFLRARKYQPCLALGSLLSTAIAYYFDKSEHSCLLLIGAASMTLIFPWTKYVMMSDILKLLKDDVISERGEAWVRRNIETWNTRHFARSLFAMTSFGIFLYFMSTRK